MTWSPYARAGRSEFNRVLIASLTASVQGEVERHRAKRHRLRLGRAERRLAELQRVSAPGAKAETQPQVATDTTRPIGAFVTVTAAWFGSAAILLLCLTLRLEPAVTGVADISLLALTLLWFVLAVACLSKLG